jgi:hypothetical protein
MHVEKYRTLILLVISIFPAVFYHGCTKEKVIVYRPDVQKVKLVYPPNTEPVFSSNPDLVWNNLGEANAYQIQVATDVAFRGLKVDSTLADTSLTYSVPLANNLYYWRVRARNADGVWGDWSEASIWSFRISDVSQFFELAAELQTPGTAQDLIIRDGIAYIADGERLLTLVDISDPTAPVMIGNLNLPAAHDYAKNVWKQPGSNFAFVADMDGKIQALEVSQPLNPESPFNRNFGLDQNLEDVEGLVYLDTVYLAAVSSSFTRRHLSIYQIIYIDGAPTPNTYFPIIQIPLQSDGLGVFIDSLSTIVEYQQADSVYYETQSGNFIFVASGEAGLLWFNISLSHTFDGTDTLMLRGPQFLGSEDTPSIAISVCVKAGFAYVADDRGGLQIFDLPDTIPAGDHDSPFPANPVLISNINTSGRTKDVQVLGNYCFLADGSGGLKVVDVADPYNPRFLAAYSTPYAFGIWVEPDYIYLADRDMGLLIFENRLPVN